MIVGLTGPNAAGKGEAALFLRECGFVYHSLSDVVRAEATARGLEHGRENLIFVGNDLRSRFGPGVLAERIAATLTGEGVVPANWAEGPGASDALRQGPDATARAGQAHARDPKSALIDSIRSPAEVAVLRRLPGFVLLGIDAPIVLRFERSCLRARVGDGATLEEFARKEALENTNDPAAQQLTRAFALVDSIVMNDGTVEDLREGVARLLRLNPPR